MNQQESVKKKRFHLVNLSRKNIIILAIMLAVAIASYVTLSESYAMGVVIVMGIVVAYETIRSLLLWAVGLVFACAKRVATGLKRAVVLAKMDDGEFDKRFGPDDESEDDAQESAEENRSPAPVEGNPDLSGESAEDTLDNEAGESEPEQPSLLPGHATIVPLTIEQARRQAIDWMATEKDGATGQIRLQKLLILLKAESPNESSFDIVKYTDDLCLPNEGIVLQAIAELVTATGIEANYEDDTGSLFVIYSGTEESDQESVDAVQAPESAQVNPSEPQAEVPAAVPPQHTDGPIKMLVVNPGKATCSKTVIGVNGLASVIGAKIDVLPHDSDPVAFVCKNHQDGDKRVFNRIIRRGVNKEQLIYDVFAITGWSNGITEISQDMMEKYSEMFCVPQVFVRGEDNAYQLY